MELVKAKANIIFVLVIAICFIPVISPAIALFIGIAFSYFEIRHKAFSDKASILLKVSIVLMGFGMELAKVISISKNGAVDTACSVFLVMISGMLLGKLLKVENNISCLVSSGTAICGGSAIAAVAPVVNAKSSEISFSLMVVFVLNGIALVLFPMLGHYFNLSQETFGYWAAIAIHDTSSVVGASATYGTQALEIATTVKLIRALWIIPLTIILSFFMKDKSSGKIKIPWFIGFFVLAIVIAYFFPQGQALYTHLKWLGKRGMVIALFFIGANISIPEIKKAGIRSFALGILLWLIIGVASFIFLPMVHP